jgi:hypothetical protein
MLLFGVEVVVGCRVTLAGTLKFSFAIALAPLLRGLALALVAA